MFKKLDAKLNNLFNFSPKEDNRKGDDSSRQTMHSSSRVENENLGDTSAHIYVTCSCSAVSRLIISHKPEKWPSYVSCMCPHILPFIAFPPPQIYV